MLGNSAELVIDTILSHHMNPTNRGTSRPFLRYGDVAALHPLSVQSDRRVYM